MLVWRIAKEKYALDRLGTGAQLSGGRWNSPGVAVIYTGLTPALCALEKLVHTSNIMIDDLVLVSIGIPDDEAFYRKYTPVDLPDDWNALPSSTSSIAFGDHFIEAQTYLGLILPSVIMPEEYNLILNPHHQAYHQVSYKIERPFKFDNRLR